MGRLRWRPRLHIGVSTKLVLAFFASMLLSGALFIALIYLVVLTILGAVDPADSALFQEFFRHRDRPEMVARAVAAGASETEIRAVAIPDGLSPRVRVRLVTSDGLVVVDSLQEQAGQELPVSEALRWFQRAAASVRIDGVQPLPIIVENEIWGYYLVSRISEDFTHTGTISDWVIQRAGILFYCGVGVVILINLLLYFFVGRHLVAPTKRISEVVGRIATGDFNARVELGDRSDELGLLARDVDRMAMRLAESQQQARAAEDARRYLVMAASHDLRTPLTALLANADLLHEGAAEDPAQALDVVRDKGHQLRRLIDDLFELAALDARREDWQTVRTDVAELVRREVIAILPELEASGVELDIAIADDPCWANLAPGKLERVVSNLIANALKYGKTGGWLGVSVQHAGPVIEISISDSGPGIAPAERERIFERFYRPDAARMSGKGGSGLGLAIARELVLRHGGQIGVDEAPGGGARFWVRLKSVA